MKNLKIAALALLALATTLPAFAQDTMSKGGMMGKKPMMQTRGTMMKGKMSPAMMMKSMMMGLTASEKKTAMAHMKKMSAAEKAVHMKAYRIAMMNGGMDMSNKMMADKMMMGMTKSEQATMKKMMSKMTPAEKAVGMKMMKNAGKGKMMMKSGSMMKKGG